MKPTALAPNKKLRERPAVRVELGSFIVADPLICHGKPTFKGTRIMVWQLFEHFGSGRGTGRFCKAFPRTRDFCGGAGSPGVGPRLLCRTGPALGTSAPGLAVPN